jgi:hypothetical protein
VAVSSLTSLLCIVLPLVLVGLAALGLSVYALVTGQGGAWVDSDGIKRAGSPTTTRVFAVLGIIGGLFIICLGVSLIPALMLAGSMR